MPPHWADGSRWHPGGQPPALKLLPHHDVSLPNPVCSSHPAGYFYHGGKKVMLFLCILSRNKSHQLPQKSTQQMALVPRAQRNSKALGCQQVMKISCNMQKTWLQPPLFRTAERLGVRVPPPMWLCNSKHKQVTQPGYASVSSPVKRE